MLAVCMQPNSRQQNLAAFKPTNQSSTHGNFISSFANDQNEDTCSIAAEEDVELRPHAFAWWQVDLREDFLVSEVSIRTPPHHYEARFLSNITVFVTAGNLLDIDSRCGTHLEDNPPVGSWISIRCAGQPRGRFVTILRGSGFRHDALSLCEVKVTRNGIVAATSTTTMTTFRQHELSPTFPPLTTTFKMHTTSPPPPHPTPPPHLPIGCKAGQHDCLDGTCISQRLLCDGSFDCSDMKDEQNCTSGNSCTSSDFVCLNHQCIPSGLECDGFPDCSDNSDELPIFCNESSTACPPGQRACKNGSCLNSSLFCDRIISCLDRTDESQELCGIYLPTCLPGQFVCYDGTCVYADSKCDGIKDCPDESDESFDVCGRIVCQPWTEFTCNDGSCVGMSKKCNRNRDCPGGEDEIGCAACFGDEFFCHLDNACIPRYRKCNGRADCKDYTDELYCGPGDCKGGSLYCPELSSCLSPSLVCNQIVDCPGGLDEEKCEQKCPSNWTKCPQGPCIPNSYICDGNKDCPYGEDENRTACIQTCGENEYYCAKAGCLSRSSLCDGARDCHSGEDESEDACSSVGDCTTKQYKCSPGKCIPYEWVCDGENDCDSGQDEASHLCARVEHAIDVFFCLSNRSEYTTGDHRCDGRPDCQDGSDEIGCIRQELVSRTSELVLLISNRPYRICSDNIDQKRTSILCRYKSITNDSRMNRSILNISGYAKMKADFKFESIFNFVEAFQKDSVCTNGYLSTLACNDTQCGTRSVESDYAPPLISGEPAESSMWGWHAMLKAEPDRICGASYIGRNFYLTSASCVTIRGRKIPLVPRVVGLYFSAPGSFMSFTNQVAAQNIFVHPTFDPATGNNDVAMVKTSGGTLSPSEICIPDPFKYTTETTSRVKVCYMTGVGLNRKDLPPRLLLKARLTMMSHKECLAHVSNTSDLQYQAFINHTTNFCAGLYKSKHGFNICEYDFGGPLVCLKDDSDWVQVGIANRNVGTGCTNSIFTRVTSYLGFINDVMISDMIQDWS